MTIQTKTYEEIMQFIRDITSNEDRARDNVHNVLVDNQFLMSYDIYNTRTDITIYNGASYEKNFSTKAANFDHFDRESFEQLLNTSLLKFLGIDKNFKIKVGGFSQNNFELRNAPIPVTIEDLLNLIDQKLYRSSDLNLFVYKNGEIHITVQEY